MGMMDLTLDEAADALACIPADDRDTWLHMAMALKSEFGDDAREVWDAWSQSADSYDATTARDVWKSVSGSGGVGIGSLIHLARQHGHEFTPGELSEAERRERQAEAARRREAAQRKARQVEELRFQARETLARTCEELLPLLYASGESEYLARKQVAAHGVYFVRQRLVVAVTGDPDALVPVEAEVITGPDRISAFFKRPEEARGSFRYLKAGTVMVPMRDIDGRLWGFQAIFPGGSKKFFKHARKQGTFHLIGSLAGAERLLIAEGYATAASLHQATGWPVAVAWDAGNLLPVATAFLGKHRLPITICGDDDAATPGNPGRAKAEAAAAAVGGVAVFPVFDKGEAA